MTNRSRRSHTSKIAGLNQIGSIKGHVDNCDREYFSQHAGRQRGLNERALQSTTHREVKVSLPRLKFMEHQD
jgi:hypothetical protein